MRAPQSSLPLLGTRPHRAMTAMVLILVAGPSLGQTPDHATKSASPPAAKAEPKKFPDWDEVVKGAQRLDGLLPLYFNKKDQKLFIELSDSTYEKEFICPISIARGAGLMFLGGDTLNFGDQWILSFRRVGDRVLVIRRNVLFRAKSGSPQADAVQTSYTDSVIASLGVKTEQGSRVLVDAAELFLRDLAGIGIMPDPTRSSWAKVKAFPHNVEIEASAVFPMGRFGSFFGFGDPSIPDPRGTQVVIHYGLSALPSEPYQPRVADDRVGHFLSVVKDYSTDVQKSPFVRYVTRWKLEKSEQGAEKSPPREPIVFWIEKTVPREYRPYVKAGILEWNKAFDKIGFIEAIQVRDQQASDDFEPEDIRYNTFRWITTSAGFAMGPSRTNPKTGQILDADIVFDESMVRFWRNDYLNMVGSAHSLNLLRKGDTRSWLKVYAAELPFLIDHEDRLVRMMKAGDPTAVAGGNNPTGMGEAPGGWYRERGCRDGCLLGPGMHRQLNMLAAVLYADGKIGPGGKIPEEYVGQAIKEVVMHEVGHTLGLRHNFKASTMLSLADCNNPEITRAKGLASSVMDYLPANFALRGEKQGDYFSSTIGPYDYWAIEYAYKPISGDEAAELKKIADRSVEPSLDYGTDEDFFSNPDPRINTFDLGDPQDFAKQRTLFAEQYLKDLADRVVAKGDGWQRARDAFSTLLGEISYSAYLTSLYIGAQYTSRDHKGEANARLPFQPIPAAKQREAIAFLKAHVLSDKAFNFSPELLNRLAAENWDHWGVFGAPGQPYSILSRILGIQRTVIGHFLDGQTLTAIQEGELRVPAGQDVVKMAEIFDSLTDAIWSELPADAKGDKAAKIEVSTIRRNLQREHVKRLCSMVLGPKPSTGLFFDGMVLSFGSGGQTPADARALARFHLKRISERIDASLSRQLDTVSRAHLEELSDQIKKTLAAGLQQNGP